MWPFCDARVKAFDVHEHNIYACVSHAGSAPTQFSHKILCLFFVFLSFRASLLGELFVKLWSLHISVKCSVYSAHSGPVVSVFVYVWFWLTLMCYARLQ